MPLLASLAASPSTEIAAIEFDYVPGDIFDAVQGSVDGGISQSVFSFDSRCRRWAWSRSPAPRAP